jgi:hypothetical protein
VIGKDIILSGHWLKLAADDGSINGEIEYGEYMLRVGGVSDIVQLAVAQHDSRAQMRLGIVLLCGCLVDSI